MPATFRTAFAMKSLLPLALLFNLILGIYSAVFLERLLEIAGHEGQCYDKEENVFFKKGEEMTWRSKECGKRICGGYRGKMFIEIKTCGKIGVPAGCYIKPNLELPYPNCCGEVICPKSDFTKNLL